MIEWRFVIPVGTLLAVAVLVGCARAPDQESWHCRDYRLTLEAAEICRDSPGCWMDKNDIYNELYARDYILRHCKIAPQYSTEVEK